MHEWRHVRQEYGYGTCKKMDKRLVAGACAHTHVYLAQLLEACQLIGYIDGLLTEWINDCFDGPYHSSQDCPPLTISIST